MRVKRSFARVVVTDTLEALRRMVYGRGALEACADECGYSHQLLSKQLNQEPGAGELWLKRAEAIEALLDTDEWVEAHCARRGGFFVRLPPIPAGADATFVEGYTKLLAEFSEASKAFCEALADGKISVQEARKFHRELRDVTVAGEQLVLAILERAEG